MPFHFIYQNKKWGLEQEHVEVSNVFLFYCDGVDLIIYVCFNR